MSSPAKPSASGSSRFTRLGMKLSDWAERWFPDAFVFALLGAIIVFLGALACGSKPEDLVKYYGDGFWSLIPFTMQMVMVVIGGYVVASSPPMFALIRWLAGIPKTPRGAVAFIAFFSTSTSLISYGFSLVFSGLLTRAIAQRVEGMDYRAAGAAAYLGLGSIWALGLSSSAALLMATKTSIPPAVLKIAGVIPLTETLYTWQNGLVALVLLVVSVLVAYFSCPVGENARTAESFGVTFEPMVSELEPRKTPGEWLEFTPILSLLIGALGLAYLWQVLQAKGWAEALNLNTYNFLFLTLGLLLHWRPRSFTRSVTAAVPSTAGVLIQFPFYAGIVGLISFSPIAKVLADFFVKISDQNTFPVLVSIYSGILGLFVPSGGGKWLLEAPYIVEAANTLKVNLGWVVQIYNTAEALPNLINPFWMLPLLGILKMKARDLVGFGLLQLMVHTPIVLFLMWALAKTLPYNPPVVP